MKLKNFKNLDEQIEILIQKGLTINDYELTRNLLLRENYFFLSGYRHIFYKGNGNRNFKEGTTFEELYAVFCFDRQIRNIIFKNILVFENNLKSIISYTISKNYGFKENNYLNLKIFDNDKSRSRQINDLIKKMKRQIRVNSKQHEATKHYLINYGYIPLWVAVKVLSFGIVGELFLVLKDSDKEEIADLFYTDTRNLEVYLPILANYRNLCAHEDICFTNKTQKCINDTKYHKILNIPQIDREYVYGKRDLFALIIIFKEVLNEDNFKMLLNEIRYEIDILNSKLNTVKVEVILDKMGFPLNYDEIGRI